MGLLYLQKRKKRLYDVKGSSLVIGVELAGYSGLFSGYTLDCTHCKYC